MLSDESDNDVSPQKGSGELLAKDPEDNLRNASSDLSDDESGMRIKTKKRVQRFSDSDSDGSKEANGSINEQVSNSKLSENSDNDEPITIFKTKSNKSRIRKKYVSEDGSDSDQQVSKNMEQQLRMKNKKQRLHDKFKTLVNSREKDIEKTAEKSPESGISDEEGSHSSNDEMSSIDKIKQKIKERTASLKMSICDPDTSDEESNQNKTVYKSKKEVRRTKLTSPKPQRMSAKQAMENMQKIKSESNRLLREKEVSLPYHRPKALSLQDIMKRRRPAVSSDGKALPIKMNEDQLKHYVSLLEQRQKEMMELCKSDTEEDEPEETNENLDNPTVNDSAANIPECDNDNNKGNQETHKEIPLKDEDPVHQNLHEVEEKLNKEGFNKNQTSTEEPDMNLVDNELKNKSGDVSAEMELVYNDSIEDSNISDTSKLDENHLSNGDINKAEEKNEHDKKSPTATIDQQIQSAENIPKNGILESEKEVNIAENKPEPEINNTEVESQLISLKYFDSEKSEACNTEENDAIINSKTNKNEENITNCDIANPKPTEEVEMADFPDEDMDMDDINLDEIDTIIENAEIIENSYSGVNSPALIKDIPVLNVKPKLTGAPGMVIDLDGTDPTARKLSGVELLKERFTYFAKLKTPEEMEREREKRQKPGTLHLKLKQELEEKIAEQRSLEWSKRLETEKQQQKELSVLRGDESEPEDDIDKIEAKLDENDVEADESSSESEEEPIEDDVCLKDKPKKKNALIADEAEESDLDETEQNEDNDKETNDVENDELLEDDIEDNNENDEDSSEAEESSESENEKEANKLKKGRILKAFEDSDDEDTPKIDEKDNHTPSVANDDVKNHDQTLQPQSQNEIFTDSQDDVLQLAQVPKQISGELFTSQDCTDSKYPTNENTTKDEDLLGTQTFSILNTNNTIKDLDLELEGSDKLTVISETQPGEDNLDAVVGMCSGSFSQNCVEFQPPTTQSQVSQPIGEDLLNMCTGNFYDNQFVSPLEDKDKLNSSDEISQIPEVSQFTETQGDIIVPNINDKNVKAKKQDEDILKSVLDELDEPELESTKPLKFFFDGKNQDKENEKNTTNTQHKKRLVIDSDDDTKDDTEVNQEQKKKKRFKKKKLEERALQISDDEEDEYSELEENEEYLSDDANAEEKLVEYDSEENEVEVQPLVVKKKKKKASEFFEQEAELTSEDEWVGSGDEDEAGLDRMEREAGDDDTFHQGRLQRELGQIHMRDVLDQDKREVRLIQELLFEDGDLGSGGRQRKFRWRDADGEEATGTVPDEFADTQEEEFESEEQWRKQRHEREMFLRQMKNEDNNLDDLNVSVNRTTIIKANLTSRTMSSLLEEVNQTKVNQTEVDSIPAIPEKKTMKDIPSPKKSFPVFQQNYHGSLLTRGRGALARLAALATPLVAQEDAPARGVQPSNKRNFVFATLTPEDTEPKVTKRKAESNVGTPRLVKKMKTEEKQKQVKSSLLDHLKA